MSESKGLGNILRKLNKIQKELKAPKNQYNDFAKFTYRSCEDILEGVKPLCEQYQCAIFLTDSVKMVGDRYYIEATATIFDVESEESYTTVAYAREEDKKDKMDRSQTTGSASSYARKYALNGLLAIDDTKDSDSLEPDKPSTQPKKTEYKPVQKVPTSSAQYAKENKEDKTIEIRYEKINKVLGIEVPTEEVKSIFKSLNFQIEELDSSLKVIVPTRRLDIKIEEDLIEEVGRIYGMDNIQGKLPVLPMQLGKFDKTRRDIKNKLVDLGLNETLSYILINDKEVNAGIVNFKNSLTKTVISKIDATTSNELPGATIEILNSDGREMPCIIIDEDGNEEKLNRCMWVSGEKPKVVMGLSSGTYYLTELIAPKGFELNKNKIEFEVLANGDVTKVEMKNELEVEVLPPSVCDAEPLASV